MTICERVRLVRKTLGLTMERFGERLEIGRAAVSQIESGKVSLSTRTARLICKEYHVNEEWLLEEVGDMFIESSIEEEIAYWLGYISVKNDADSEFKKSMVYALSRLNDEGWKALQEVFEDMMARKKDLD